MVQPSYPGVYVQEKSSGPGPITGVSTSNLGLVGFTTRGRVNYPVLCTSFADYVAKFGTFTGSGLAPTMAYAFFANGGQRLYMARAVHSDAAAGSVYWSKGVTNEVLTSTAQVTGHYAMDTNKVPVVAVNPGTCTVIFDNANPLLVNGFRDNGSGTMAFDATISGAGASGGAGAIDYESGEITIQLTDPTQYTGGAQHVHANYSYKVATFTMQWPGVAGNLFRVKIVGSPDYYDQATAAYTAFKITVEENIGTTGAVWQVNETFDEVVLDDTTDSKYFKTIINDVAKGSQYITVTDYGNAQNPEDLQGVAITAEDFSGAQVPAYNGTVKAFTYTMANAVAPGTLEASFQFTEALFRIGTGDGTANPTCNALGHEVEVGDGTVLGAKVRVNATLSILGAVTLWDNGAGSLRSGVAPGTAQGTIAYTTGAVTLACAGGNVVVAGTSITISTIYADDVIVVDDANGGVSIQTPAVGTDPPTKFQLNTSGTNGIDYDTGVLSLTWKIVGQPADGPAGLAVATPATKVSTAAPWILTPGASFTLAVDAVPAAPVAFTAAAATQADTTVYPVANQIGLTVTVALFGFPLQTVTFAGATTTALHVAAEMNAQVVGASFDGSSGQVICTSDQKGHDATILCASGTAVLTWAAPVAGTGNVGNIMAVTAAEYETIVEAATTAEVQVVGNVPTTTGLVLGVTGQLTFADVTPGILTALGILAPLTVNGTAGSYVGTETADYYTQPDDYDLYTMTGGLDGSATTRADVTAAALEADNDGMYALKLADEIMQVVIADFQTDDAVCRDVITFCENMGDKFGLFSIPEGLDEQEAVNWRKFTLAQYSNKVAAPYYPHIRITDPVTDATANIPSGGHISGVYARCDNNRNVGTAPAGVENGKLLWLEGFESDLSRAQVGYCDENKVNCLVGWPQTGMCVWGNSTLEAPGGEFLEVQQRRLFQYVEKSVFNSTHIHVFANNGPALWASITLQVTNFLLVLFNAGYLGGTTPDEAFFVVCDSTNNDADTNLVYCDVGLRTNRAAKFIVFTFSQLVL